MAETTVTCVDIYGKEHIVPASQLKWRPSVYAVIIKSGSLLVSKQFDSYDLPGGGLDLGETPEAGVIRETKEETGLVVANPKLLAVRNSFFTPTHAKMDVYYQALMLYYTCEYVSGEFSIAGFDEHEKQYADMPEWLPLEQLDQIKPASTVDWREIVRTATENS